MSSVAPTVPTLTIDPLTIIVGSASCIVFFIVIIVLLFMLYNKNPLCCRDRPYRGPQHYTDAHPQYHSRHSLIGYAQNEHSAAINQGAFGPQLTGRLFIVGKPNDYHLDGPLPRLPSYESVRKKDRQRHIHSMIAQRFGLSRSHGDSEPPPTYEETLHQSIEITPLDLQSSDVHLSVHTDYHSSQLIQETYPDQQSPRLQGPTSTHCPTQTSNRGLLSV